VQRLHTKSKDACDVVSKEFRNKQCEVAWGYYRLLYNLLDIQWDHSLSQNLKQSLLKRQFPPKVLENIQEVVKSQKKTAWKSEENMKLNEIRKDAQIFIASLVEYIQRGKICELDK